ncbi:LysR family transcriptional regulator [Clostridium hydrogenum]|uniref:LysR family transcriptional regulator n=1 Tax=Clostridium hydrogenum TaxID=2855764 RepID=UPI001F2A6DFC|nr:LysR family transcriptional regulator [Clostridium hydrogenum]
MNLRDLEYFNCLCKTKNFTETAKVLYVSQPSVTMALHRLEKELCGKLVVRDHSLSKFSLTEAGKILEKHVINIFNELNETKFEISKVVGRKIKLGVPPIIGAYFFPTFMEQLVKNGVAENIELVETGSAAMKNLILSDEVDMALIGSLAPIESTDIAATILKIDKFMVCMSKNHAISKKESLNFKDISKEKFIVLGDAYIHNEVLKNIFLKNGASLDNFYSTDEIQTAKSLIGSGLGIGIMIHMAVKNMPTIKTVPLAEPINFYISLAIKKEHYMTPIEQKIKKVLLNGNQC